MLIQRTNPALAIVAIAVSLLSAPLAAQDSEYPLIERVHHGDPLYRQQQDAIQQFYLDLRAGRELAPLTVYRYRPDETDTLIRLASRFTLPYSTLASINRLSQSELPADPDLLLIPSAPGIFVPANPHSDLEQLLYELRIDREYAVGPIPVVIIHGDAATRFFFFPGDDFDRVERLAFLNILFRRPVQNIRISSPYGYRSSPFGGNRSFHAGVDFVAPLGTPVQAAREGEVRATGFDPIYGNFVLLTHRGGYETFYGHLDQITVRLNDEVSSGMIIGTVGNSGLSTGPHLHFEIRLNGETRDPALLMPGLRR